MFRLAIACLIVVSALGIGSAVQACGGLFCQNIPVDQQAERIIFTVNSNDTISAYVQINYTGSAPDFSWVVPVPSVPEVDVAEIASFDELSTATAPQFIPPPPPECAILRDFDAEDSAVAESVPAGGVEVLSTGTAGPFAFDVITSDDPNALITWLRTNDYQVTEPMEPLIRVYNEENMVFLAMKLQPDQAVQDIQPVKMTYEGTTPMIPLRLTAVAANPNMSVLTWVFADAPAYPVNYANPVVPDEDIRFDFLSGQNNYLQVLDNVVDQFEGRAFVTEMAQPTFTMTFSDPLLQELSIEHQYVTRFFGRISPEEMTVDPIFDFDPALPDVSNIHDLSDFDPETVWFC